MSILEKKIDALLSFCAAETEDDRAEALANIREIIKSQPLSSQESAALNEDLAIRRALLELGIPDRLLGHKHLVTAIAIAISDPDSVRGITKKLYPRVAEAHNSTVPMIERTIRHAVEVAWDRGDQEILRKYFGSTADPMKGKSTNGEFIARVANIIRLGV